VAGEAAGLRPVIHRTVWVLLERLLPQLGKERRLSSQHRKVDKECVEGILGEEVVGRRSDAAKGGVSHGRVPVKIDVNRSVHDTE